MTARRNREDGVLRKQIWDARFRARLSALYYQLTTTSTKRWQAIGTACAVVLVILIVSVVSMYPSKWLSMTGAGGVPLLIALVEALIARGRAAEAERMYEKWADVSHDISRIWDRVETELPDWDDIEHQFSRADERFRGVVLQEHGAANRKRTVEAERLLYSELGIAYNETEQS